MAIITPIAQEFTKYYSRSMARFNMHAVFGAPMATGNTSQCVARTV